MPRRRVPPVAMPITSRRLTVDEVIDGPRPGREDPAADATWLDLRRVLFRAECGHPKFDPRLATSIPAGLAREAWGESRRAWLADDILRGDPRVEVDRAT